MSRATRRLDLLLAASATLAVAAVVVLARPPVSGEWAERSTAPSAAGAERAAGQAGRTAVGAGDSGGTRPHGERTGSGPSTGRREAGSQEAARPLPAHEAAPLPPPEVAQLFGRPIRRPSPAARGGLPPPPRPAPSTVSAQPSATAPPRAAATVRYLARATTAAGAALFLFKEEATGRVLALEEGRPKDGWELALVLPEAFVLDHRAARWRVER